MRNYVKVLTLFYEMNDLLDYSLLIPPKYRIHSLNENLLDMNYGSVLQKESLLSVSSHYRLTPRLVASVWRIL